MKLALILIMTISLSSSHAIDKQDISQYEINVSSSKIDKIIEEFEVISHQNEVLQVYVPTFRTHEFLGLAPFAKLIEQDIYSNDLNIELKSNLNIGHRYETYEDIVEGMKQLALDFPQYVKLGIYGQSIKKNNLYYLKISDNVQDDENENQLLFTAATHGDELITTDTMMSYITSLVKQIDSNELVKERVDNNELFFIPIVNPDGYKRKRRYTSNGLDPNRQYPYPDKPDTKSVKCIAEKIIFFNERNFVGSIDFHAHGEMIMYPWAYTYDRLSDSDEVFFHELGMKMATTNNYEVGQISEVIYKAPASSSDYYFWRNNTIAFAVEIGTSKRPRRSSQVQSNTNDVSSIINSFIDNLDI